MTAARHIHRRLLLGAAIGAAMAIGVVPAALANGGFAMGVEITSSRVTFQGEEGGSCAWEVQGDVTVVNLTDQAITFDTVRYNVSWTADDGSSGVVQSVDVRNDGGLTPGTTLAPQERRDFNGVVLSFFIPCRASFGDLAIRIDSARGSGSGDAPFLSDGAPVPPGAYGALGLAALVAAYAVSRRYRAPAQPVAP